MTTKVAFLFPGQGSQTVGMGADIFASSAAARSVFEQVDTALDFPLSQLCFNGPDETLRETINAQPAIVTVSMALLAALQEALSETSALSWTTPLTPAFTAGHSVGEYAALVASGSLSLADAVRLVRTRGRLMHHEETICPGSMAAVIALDEEILHEVCAEATAQASSHRTGTHPGEGQVAIANYNAPGQIVISGEHKALELAMELAKARGARKVMPLAVSGAFHSPVMQPAAAGLAQALAAIQINEAQIPLIGNVQASPLTSAAAIRAELSQQVAASVQWTRSIEYIANAGVTTFIEIGLGQALTGMVKRITKGATLLNISNGADITKVASTLHEIGITGV
ncbi:MAG TPA: ACP S-malonyltransferase [Ktedonobacteraceae bacterium]|nr:ACP S-malonyltransferase [Ktedonobacteraceae bacterium]